MKFSDRIGDYLVSEKIGKKQGLTPEGFLLCEGVAVARVGEQLYGPDETPIKGPNAFDPVMIVRSPDEVFRPETIASFEGKDIVDDHPTEDVGPHNWRTLTVGHAQNVRRGEDAESDFLFADFIIKDAAAIAAVRAGKREVSCGYDADYEQIGPGRGRQKNIIGNHIALVERGRCGPRCAIGDTDMAAKKLTVRDRLMAAFGVNTADGLAKVLDAEELPESGMEGMGGGVVIHNHAPVGDAEEPEWFKKKSAEDARRFGDIEGAIANMDKRWNDSFGKGKDGKGKDEDEEEKEEKVEDEAILGNLEFEAPPGTGDKARKARDSVYLADSFQDTVAGAEILVPGISIPTFDQALSPVKTFDAICALRRKALEGVTTDAAVTPLLQGIDLKRASCGDMRTLFRSAVAIKKTANSVSLTGDKVGFRIADGGKPITLADLNKRNAEHFKRSA